MKGDLRCIEGRLFRHDPQLDDPDLETDVGECPECQCPEFQGKGCEEVDYYGNPVDGGRIINCCFPDCGCDGARLCMAENGPSSGSMSLNLERRKR